MICGWRQNHCDTTIPRYVIICQNLDCIANASLSFVVVDAECRKSADKAATKQKRETKQSLADTFTKASKSYAAYTNQPVDSKVQLLKRMSGRINSNLINKENRISVIYFALVFLA